MARSARKADPARPTKKPTKAGRPSKYSAALAKRICVRMAGGESLRKICKDATMPALATVLSWATGHTEAATAAGFPEQYAIARATRTELYADEIVDLADDESVDPQRSRLQVDARKWVASKLLPKTYGERLALSGPGGGPIETRETGVDLSKLSTPTLRKVVEELRAFEAPPEK